MRLSRFQHKCVAVTAAGVVAVLGSTRAFAAATANLTVNATVTNSCKITAGALAFGSYDPVNANGTANLDGSGTLTVACTKGFQTDITLNNGSNAGAGTQRLLKDAQGNLLNYELYSNSGRTTVWNAATPVSTGVALNKSDKDYTIYGRVLPNQDVPAGTYSDTIVATVNF